MTDLTATRLRELLHYDPGTGVFTRRAGRFCIAGTSHSKGYRTITVDRHQLYAHRLAWLYVHGVMPSGQIDHIDGVKTNNCISNLRDVSCMTNNQNQRKPRRTNKTGLLGVCAPCRGRKDYRAVIWYEGKLKQIGRFPTPEQAHSAYVQAKRQLHPGCTL